MAEEIRMHKQLYKIRRSFSGKISLALPNIVCSYTNATRTIANRRTSSVKYSCKCFP